MTREPDVSGLSTTEYAAIGKVVVAWAEVESTLRYMLQRVGRIEGAVALKLTATMQWSATFDMLTRLAHEPRSETPLMHRLNASRKVLSELAGERNSLAHTDWGDLEGQVAGIVVKARDKVSARLVRLSVPGAEALAERIRSANRALWDLLSDYERGALGPKVSHVELDDLSDTGLGDDNEFRG